MIFYYNLSGELISYIPQTVYQGSNLINAIYFVAPVPSGDSVGVSFALPNGTVTRRFSMSLVQDFSDEILDGLGNGYSVYEYKLPFSITKDYGSCSIQFSVYSQNEEEILTTESVTFIIEKGVYSENQQLASSFSDFMDYSKTETNTGAKWIDGKDIYKTTLTTNLTLSEGVPGSINTTLLIRDVNKSLIKSEGVCDFTYDEKDITIPINTYFSRLKKLNYLDEVYVNFYKSDKFVIEVCLPVTKAKLTLTYFYTKD